MSFMSTIHTLLTSWPGVETELLLAAVLDIDKTLLYSHSDLALTQEQEIQLNNMVEKRRAGMPMAYILGEKQFCGLKFTVTPDTLIPRPETEWLVEQATKYILESMQSKADPVHIVDIGTGSGCIAISIYKKLGALDMASRIEIIGIDISQQALEVAYLNGQKFGTNIAWTKGDLLQNLTKPFDLLIANLPYVPETHYIRLQDNLRYEPKLALVDKEGWPKTAQLLEQAKLQINAGGVILLEHDPSAFLWLQTFAHQLFPEKKITVHTDLQNLQRYLVIK
jgi:release factor glutamine methyltransferase